MKYKVGISNISAVASSFDIFIFKTKPKADQNAIAMIENNNSFGSLLFKYCPCELRKTGSFPFFFPSYFMQETGLNLLTQNPTTSIVTNAPPNLTSKNIPSIKILKTLQTKNMRVQKLSLFQRDLKKFFEEFITAITKYTYIYSTTIFNIPESKFKKNAE
jgi:hypothetical protein